MIDSPARVAADLAALLPMDDPLARLARLRLDAAVRAERRTTMTDPRDVPEVILVGAPLRDAAVDPRPEDYQAPVNAGTVGPDGNPHGPNVVAVQALSPRSGQAPSVSGPDARGGAA